MPITYEIDRSQRIVFTKAVGILTPQDVFAYQREVWSTPELRHYDECIDMSDVTSVEGATEMNMKALAALSVQTDDPAQPSKLVIIASEKLHFGLARMYETYRSLERKHSRQVAIFRTREEALRWLTRESTAP